MGKSLLCVVFFLFYFVFSEASEQVCKGCDFPFGGRYVARLARVFFHCFQEVLDLVRWPVQAAPKFSPLRIGKIYGGACLL